MKKLSIILFIATINVFSFAQSANNNSKEANLEKSKELIKNQPVKFLENKGQMIDMDGNLVPFVLFKAEAPGVNLFIEKKHLPILQPTVL